MTLHGRRTPDRPTKHTPQGRVRLPLVPDLRAGACAGHPQPHLWDPKVDGETRGQRRARRLSAAGICAGCPERDRCPTAVQAPSTRPRNRDSSDPTTGSPPPGEWWTTHRACEYLGMPVTKNSATRLRQRGITPAPGVPGRQLLWNATQVRAAPPQRPQGRAGAPAKIAEVRRLTADGLPPVVIARRVGYSTRYVRRLRERMHIPPADSRPA